MWRTCCNTIRGGEHMMECPKWEPPLTVEEIRHLRKTLLADVKSDAVAELEPRSEVLDGIILSVVRSLRWRPYDPGCDGKCARDECVCPQ